MLLSTIWWMMSEVHPSCPFLFSPLEPQHLINLQQAIAHLQLDTLLLKLLFKPLLYGGVLASMFAGLLAWLLARPVVFMVESIDTSMSTFLQVPFRQSLASKHVLWGCFSDSLARMVSNFDRMLKGQSNLLHHVSHELRSPLARIQVALGLAQQNPQKIDAALQRVELEVRRMEKMIAELLEMFRLESGVQKLRLREMDIKTVLTATVNDIRFEFEHARVHLKMPEQSVMMQAQLELFQRALGNVIRNAVKYGPKDGIVNVELVQMARGELTAAGGVLIRISDQGSGVPVDELQHIFLPFVRGKNVGQVEGHGIGLAMTKHIVEAHGGFVTAENLDAGGLLVSMHFPYPAKVS